MGYALHLAQHGEKADNVKPLKGFSGAGVVEIVDDYDGDTYRSIYTVKFKGAVYVLHAFQKKSKKGKETPRQEMKLVEQRLKTAREHHEKKYSKNS